MIEQLHKCESISLTAKTCQLVGDTQVTSVWLHFLSLGLPCTHLYMAPKSLYAFLFTTVIKCLVDFSVGSAHHLTVLNFLSRAASVGSYGELFYYVYLNVKLQCILHWFQSKFYAFCAACQSYYCLYFLLLFLCVLVFCCVFSVSGSIISNIYMYSIC